MEAPASPVASRLIDRPCNISEIGINGHSSSSLVRSTALFGSATEMQNKLKIYFVSHSIVHLGVGNLLDPKLAYKKFQAGLSTISA